MLILQKATYIHPNKEVLFQDLDFVVNKNEKIALIGNNGTGKSTLLKIIAGQLPLNSGLLQVEATPYYIPQNLDAYQDKSIAEALSISEKWIALQEILAGEANEHNMEILNDDWTLEDRVLQALEKWDLADVTLDTSLSQLSGGQKTKVFLAGISIHEPEFILLDEPSNHLDKPARKQLYDFIEHSNSAILLVSHDRQLLQLMPYMAELSQGCIKRYGGNYDFYVEQKEIEQTSLSNQVQNQQKELRKAKDKEREAIERQNKLNARGKKKQEAAGIPKILMGALKNKAEGSSSKLKSVHEEKISGIRSQLSDLRAQLPEIDQMQFNFDESGLHLGKLLIEAKEINYKIKDRMLWKEDISLQIRSGERIHIQGANGSGKTTLIKMLLNKLEPSKGNIQSTSKRYIYIDQEYSLVQTNLSVYEMAQSFNNSGLQEHDIKIRLNRFLFGKDAWDKNCLSLSGGERMRLLLCCLNISTQAPDIMVLDEPTNNIDLQNIIILTEALRNFKGTILVVSHDENFILDLQVNREISLL